MTGAQISRTISMTAYSSLTVAELRAFISEMEEAGMDMDATRIRWTSYAGDQRDPATLTLSAVRP